MFHSWVTLYRVLAGCHSPSHHSVPLYRRVLYGKIDFKSKFIGIKGPHGAGKSTLLRQYAKLCGIEPSKILFINCDDPMMAEVSLYDVAEAFYARGGKLLSSA